MGRLIIYGLYQPYKWLVFFPFLAFNTVVFGLMAVLVSTLVNQKAGSYIGGVLWSRLNTYLTPVRVKVTGKENIRPGTSYVVVANHQSYYDIFVLYGWLGLDIKWVMKKELAKIPGLGFGSRKVGHIFIDRSNKRVAIESLQAARAKLVNGTSVVIFPEGTRSNTDLPGPFKKGAFKLAIELNLPLLPVTITGTRRILPAGSNNLKPGKAGLIVHPAIDVSLYTDDNLNDLIRFTRDMIIQSLGQDE